jgi:hypothetical protein
MTTLQDNAVGPAFQNELISPARLLLLASSEPRAPIAILSPAKRNALVACFNAGGLHKRDGAWHGHLVASLYPVLSDEQATQRCPRISSSDVERSNCSYSGSCWS